MNQTRSCPMSALSAVRFRAPLGLAAFVLCGGLALPLQADTITSLASSAVSNSVGSVSDSISGSSESSSGKKAELRAGRYRIERVEPVLAEAPTQADRAVPAGLPPRVQLHLRAVPEQGVVQTAATATEALVLTLPQAAFAPTGLAAGDSLQVNARPHGWAVLAAGERAPFFLVLHDPVRRELESAKL